MSTTMLLVLKGIGLLSLVLAGGGIGLMMSDKLRRRAESLGLYLRLVKRIAVQLRYTAAPIGDIVSDPALVREFSGLAAFSEAVRAVRIADFPTAWQQGLQKGVKLDSLTEQDAEILLAFGRSIGTTDLEGQIAHCEMYSQILEERLSLAKTEQEKKGKLCRMMGLSAGLALAILLI